MSTHAEATDPPPVHARFFHATDVPKRDESHFRFQSGMQDGHDLIRPGPARWKPFSVEESERIEAMWREARVTSQPRCDGEPFKVQVGQDLLFEVDVTAMELSSIYWKGPVYEVRRAIWFFSSAEGFSPCDAVLTEQIERGYLDMRGWVDVRQSDGTTEKKTGPLDFQPNGTKQIESGLTIHPPTSPAILSTEIPPTPFTFFSSSTSYFQPPPRAPTLPKISQTLLHAESLAGISTPTALYEDREPGDPQARRLNSIADRIWEKKVDLEGPYKGQYVVFPGGVDGWWFSEGITSSLVSGLYLRLTNGANLGGTKLVKGFDNLPDDSQAKTVSEPENAPKHVPANVPQRSEESEDNRHLILVVHGIGAKLAEQFENSTFLGQVDRLRYNIKSQLGNRSDAVVVIPVQWRQVLEDREEPSTNTHPTIPTTLLQEITLPSIPSVKAVGATLAVDVLVYMTPRYRAAILEGLATELNFVVGEWKKRNPKWRGGLSLVGHSLGSCLVWDVLERGGVVVEGGAEGKEATTVERNPSLAEDDAPGGGAQPKENAIGGLSTAVFTLLTFTVENFFAIGSPLPLFLVLHRHPATLEASDFPPCGAFYNVFDPFDPIAHRIEPLVSRSWSAVPPAPTIQTVDQPGPCQNDVKEKPSNDQESRSSRLGIANSVITLVEGLVERVRGVDAREPTANSLDGESLSVRGDSALISFNPQLEETFVLQARIQNTGAVTIDKSTTPSNVDRISPSDLGQAIPPSVADSTTVLPEQGGGSSATEPKERIHGESILSQINPKRNRLDFTFSSSESSLGNIAMLSSASAYWSAATAHNSYWESTEMAKFIVDEVVGGDLEEK